MLTQAWPWLPLPWQTPVQGLDGVPAQAAPVIEPIRQIGHGCALLPVNTVRAVRRTLSTMPPVDVSSVPAAGALNVFSVQTDSPAFGTGSGVPNRQPVAEQSYADVPVEIGPTVHDEPVQEVENRVAEPDGVAESATVV